MVYSIRYGSGSTTLIQIPVWSDFINTICPRSSDPNYIVTYFLKWVTTTWTNSTYSSFYSSPAACQNINMVTQQANSTRKKQYLSYLKSSMLYFASFVYVWCAFSLSLISFKAAKAASQNRFESLSVQSWCLSTYSSYLNEKISFSFLIIFTRVCKW